MSNSSFPTVFSRLVLQARKNQGLYGKGLNHYLTYYQTTNFRLFQTEKVCRRQFRIDENERVIQTSRKHCGKRRNCSLRAISPFPTVFSKACFPWVSKGVIVWEWVNNKFLDVTKLKAFADIKSNVAKMTIFLFDRLENSVGKGENDGYMHSLLFPDFPFKPFSFGLFKVLNMN